MWQPYDLAFMYAAMSGRRVAGVRIEQVSTGGGRDVCGRLDRAELDQVTLLVRGQELPATQRT